jgi:hypothetical protein
MKTIHFLLGLVLYLSIAAVGLALMVSTQYPEFIQIAQGAAHGLPGWMRVATGVGVIAYLFAFLLTGLRWQKSTFITFENANGTVSVSASAVQEYLNGLKGEFAAVSWLKSHLRVAGGALEVGLVLGVKDGTQIPELCKLMQTRVRELLEEHLGTCDLRGVSVEVNEIRSRNKPAPEPAA